MKKLVALLFAASLAATPATLLAASTEAMSDMTGKAASMMDKININTASVEALAEIPGIGDKIGQAIAAYRDANGAFKSVADLVNVEGIDAALLEKIKPFLTI